MTFGYKPDSLREVENVLLDEHGAKVGMSENSLVEEGGGGNCFPKLPQKHRFPHISAPVFPLSPLNHRFSDIIFPPEPYLPVCTQDCGLGLVGLESF